MSEITAAVTIGGLDALIAAEVKRQLALRLDEREADRWLSTRDAAEYLGLTPNALHKMTAAQQVPFSQDSPGGKCWFLRSELDEWRRDGR